MKEKIVKFMFRDVDLNDLTGFDLAIDDTMTWLDVEKSLNAVLSMFTFKENNCVAPTVDQWMNDKRFPDGKHYFIRWNNDWGFTSAYLFRVED